MEEHLAKSPDRELFCNMNSGTQNPEDALLIQEEHEEVERLLLQLPMQQRIAVAMRDIDGLSYEEIAESMHISIGTVKSRIARGRETLKRCFKGAKS